VQRAKASLGVRCRRVHVDDRPVSYWLLSGQELPAGLSKDPEFDRLLAELEKQYPPPTPLDEEETEDDGR
jgi:hypothetical protein